MRPQSKPYKNEADFKDKAKTWLRERFGNDVWFYPPSDRFQKGLPEFVICFYGYFVGPELKNGTSYDPQPLQKRNAIKIQRANGFAFVSRNLDEFKQSMENIYQIVKNKC